MPARDKQLTLSHIDLKINAISPLNVPVPGQGWIHGIRTALNMTLSQLAQRLQMTPQQLKAFEKREKEGTISLNSLKRIAAALEMNLIYAITPKDQSLTDIVKTKAREKAKEIVNRTAHTMDLEGQGNNTKRLQQAISEKTNQLTEEMPHLLWD